MAGSGVGLGTQGGDYGGEGGAGFGLPEGGCFDWIGVPQVVRNRDPALTTTRRSENPRQEPVNRTVQFRGAGEKA